MAGLTYDSSEVSRVQEFLSQQEAYMSDIDKEKEFADKNVLRYTLIIAGSIIGLIAFKFLISRKKR